ncbi:MAG TPA: DUF72 domain-containing protein [Actinobacteria bacterium]|nr:DUF72 domain-containing protein [Actinomycetota bacterium]
MALHVGTSGFAFPQWVGPFYPPGTGAKRMLPFYGERLRSVEINHTFRTTPSERTLTTWREQTPEGFVFAVKAHQRITHWLRLNDAAEAAGEFLRALEPLRPKLGPVLFQCPPTLAFDRDLLQRFLDGLPPSTRAAFEFRHPSWRNEQASLLLAERGAAWCVAETDDQEATSELPPGAFVYLRLRRTTYPERRLKAWADRLTREDREVYCYFKHEDGGAGPAFAARLQRMVTWRARTQPRAAADSAVRTASIRAGSASFSPPTSVT